MADDETSLPDGAPSPEGPDATPKKRGRWRYGVLAALLTVVALFGIGMAVLNSPYGHRFILNRIASYAPASGLRVNVGRIEGSVYSAAILHDVTFSDPQGPFLKVPRIELDWRPFNWFIFGLDVRKFVTRQGTLMRFPKLRPGNPNAPILPNFDIRVDRLQIDRMAIAKQVLGQERLINLTARADIRQGRVLLRTEGQLGGEDRLYALVDTEPDRDRFDIELDYAAPKGGFLAGLTGAKKDADLRITGRGGWKQWNGAILARQNDKNLAAFRLTNRSGKYAILGQAWPEDLLKGLPKRAIGKALSLDAQGTLKNSVVNGRLRTWASAFAVDADGAVDLGGNAFDNLAVKGRIIDPKLLGGATVVEGMRLSTTLDGKFRELEAPFEVAANRLTSGIVRIEPLTAKGTLTRNEQGWDIPLQLAAGKIQTGNATVDPMLVKPQAKGTLVIRGSQITSDNLDLSVPGLAARLVLSGDTSKGAYGLAGTAAARGVRLPNLGTANADGKLVLRIGEGSPWLLRTNLTGRMLRVENATLTSLAGTGIRFSGGLRIGGNQPLFIERATLDASKINLAVASRVHPGGRIRLVGGGKHADYGAFTVDTAIEQDGLHAVLVFADPYPPAGLKDVHISLAPIRDGFRIETKGASAFGPFNGAIGLFAAPGKPTRFAIEHMQVSQTAITGALTFGNGAADGELVLSGGGADGKLRLAPRNGGQGINLALRVRDARFGGEPPITISRGQVEADGLILKGHSTIRVTASGQGIGRGSLFLGRVAANAELNDGNGSVTASLSGRRGSRFELQLNAKVAPNRVTLLANGEYAGRTITMPRRAVATREDGGWRLEPSQINLGDGRLIASGVSAHRRTDLNLALAHIPLSLGDILVADLGLGGTASGVVDYHSERGAPPRGQAQVVVKGLTRSGLVLTSRPIDIALVAALMPTSLETRAVLKEGDVVRGRMQGRISGFSTAGTLGDRLRSGNLFAQMRYDGPVDSLWRLIAVEVFDMTGPVTLAADVTGTMQAPIIRGTLGTKDLRIRSAAIGTDVSGVVAQGRFSGSRLELTGMSGKTPNGGQVSGSGSVDFTGLGTHAPAIDLRLAANDAQILARSDMAATVTGPLRLISDGVGGTIAGRVAINKARWQLGRAPAIAALPDIPTREINRRSDIAPPRARAAPWRYLIDAAGDDRIAVRGLGLDSVWAANIKLRGTTANPTILGTAELVRGNYEFSGTQFELTRGKISFDGNSPPDPRLDILAVAEVTGLTARVTIGGTSAHPEITFSSIPAMPEEEVLSRLLFGSSIADISAPEAVQLAAAVASLQGGGGMDPINKLRSAIGIDRLRIVPADPARGRETAVAVGEYLGRRFYIEAITDGRGYTATELEFRVTSWLSLLATMSTTGHNGANVKVSKDY